MRKTSAGNSGTGKNTTGKNTTGKNTTGNAAPWRTAGPRRALTALLAVLLLAGTAGCGAAKRRAAADERAIVDATVNMSFEGHERSFLLHRPANPPSGVLKPALLVFHGGGGDPAEIAADTGFDAAADKTGFVVAYPAGYEHSWNDERTGDTKANLAGVDDIGFVSALIDKLVAEDGVDPKRVYATGMSNGAMFTEMLGCRLGVNRIAGIAPVAGTMPKEAAGDCYVDQAGHQIPVLEIHGTADPIVPYGGGHVAITSGSGIGQPGPAVVLSVAATRNLWLRQDGCDMGSRITTLPDTAADGTQVEVDYSVNCAAHTSVVLFTVKGGGHTWPGGSQYLPAALVGKASKQFRATDAIMDFFAADAAGSR